MIVQLQLLNKYSNHSIIVESIVSAHFSTISIVPIQPSSTNEHIICVWVCVVVFWALLHPSSLLSMLLLLMFSFSFSPFFLPFQDNQPYSALSLCTQSRNEPNRSAPNPNHRRHHQHHLPIICHINVFPFIWQLTNCRFCWVAAVRLKISSLRRTNKIQPSSNGTVSQPVSQHPSLSSSIAFGGLHLFDYSVDQFYYV